MFSTRTHAFDVLDFTDIGDGEQIYRGTRAASNPRAYTAAMRRRRQTHAIRILVTVLFAAAVSLGIAAGVTVPLRPAG